MAAGTFIITIIILLEWSEVVHSTIGDLKGLVGPKLRDFDLWQGS